MLSKNETTNISKALSYILRHNPGSINLTLDDNGWAKVDELIEKFSVQHAVLSFDVLKHVVDTNTKKRFSFNKDFTKIRASQGHSIDIDLNYTDAKPPSILYHGTTDKYISSILDMGLQKMNRHHVHLSVDVETAMNVGQRHGKPVILKVKAEDMWNAGHKFYLSDNGVWLTDHVPVKFILNPDKT